VCDIETALHIGNEFAIQYNNSFFVCLDNDSELCRTGWLICRISFCSCIFIGGSLVSRVIVAIQYGIYCFLVRRLCIIHSARYVPLIETRSIVQIHVRGVSKCCDIVLIIKRRRRWSSRLLLTVCVSYRTLCRSGLRWCGVDIIIAIGITNVVNHCLWITWLTNHCFIIWTMVVQRFMLTRIMLARIMLSNRLFKAFCGQEWCLTRILLLKDRAENWHHVTTETLCRI
jgi:hypothetical protein